MRCRNRTLLRLTLSHRHRKPARPVFEGRTFVASLTLAERLEKLRQRNSKGIGELAESGDSDIAFAPFDATHVVPVQAGTFREGLL
jgi:hypothetical protein